MWRLLVALAVVFAADGQTVAGRNGGIKGSTFTTGNRQERMCNPGARIRIEYVGGGVPAAAVTTDEARRFLAAELPAGRYYVVAEFPGMNPVDLDAVVEAGWNVELQQQVLPDHLHRVGYRQRNTVRDFFLNPERERDLSELLLYNSGRSRYREFQITARHQIHKHVRNASYVRSSAISDLNDFIPYSTKSATSLAAEIEPGAFRDFAPRICRRPNNSPSRSAARNTKPMWDGGSSTFSTTTTRDIQSNMASPRYGVFLNSVDRIMRGKLVPAF
jgi:hypothetical protein